MLIITPEPEIAISDYASIQAQSQEIILLPSGLFEIDPPTDAGVIGQIRKRQPAAV